MIQLTRVGWPHDKKTSGIAIFFANELDHVDWLTSTKTFLDALASLDLKLSVSQ